MNRKLILLIFAMAYVLLLGSAFAQPAAPVPDQLQSVAGAERDDAQDRAAVTEGTHRDVETARIEATQKAQSAQLAIMQAQQLFWLQVLQTVMPLLSAIGIALVAYLQVKAARERSLMAQSINGMKTELVANTRAAAFHEGALLQAAAGSPEAPAAPVVQRGIELAEEARKAGQEASKSAALAAGEKPAPLIGQPPAKPPEGLAADTILVKPGESATVSATEQGTEIKPDK